MGESRVRRNRKDKSVTDQSIKIPVAGGQSLSAAFVPVPQKENDPIRQKMPPLVILAHGFPFTSRAGGESALFHRIAMVLAERGLPSLTFDFRGCGESHGRTEDFTLGGASVDFAAVMNWARGAGFSRFFFVAEGLGATVALTKIDPDVKAIALLWPVLDPRATAISQFQADPDMPLPPAGTCQTFNGQKIGQRLLYEMVNTDLAPFLRKVQIPVLIQHGDEDTFVKPDQLDLIRACLRSPRADITTYQGGDHGLTDPSLRKYILFHIKEFFGKYA